MNSSEMRNEIHVFINGVETQVSSDQAFLPLAQYLRAEANLPGTKIVCAEGDCGACTVLVSRWTAQGWSDFQTLNSCIAPVYLFDLCSIITVEGLAQEEELSEVQANMREHHGAQCGYCTPGIVCALSGLADSCADKNKALTEKKVRNHLTGNLCRCTGYEPILSSAMSIDLTKWTSLKARYLVPVDTQKLEHLAKTATQILAPNKTASAPTDLLTAIELKATTPELRIVAGATDLGVLHNKGKFFLDQVLILNRIPELSKIERTAQGVWVGAQVTLTQVENFCEDSYPELSRLLHIFASPQIKNQGTLLGNILNGSPIGDSLPALLVLEAELHLTSTRGKRVVPLTSFYKGYKFFDIQPDEIAVGLSIPNLQKGFTSKFYKVSLRKDLDISAVTFAGLFKIENSMISEARLALGGVGPTVVRLPDLEKDLAGAKFSEAVFQNAGKKARSLIKPISDLRATDQYRLQVTENLFQKCYEELNQELTPCL